MANPTGFSVLASERPNVSDISGMYNISSSSSPTTESSTEEKKKQQSHGGAAQVSAPAEPATAPLAMVTEQNVQPHTATHKKGGTSIASSALSSRDKSRRCEMARAAFEMAQARVSMLAAEHEMSAGSHAGSVGRRLDDVRSDTGSSGPSLRVREMVQENPFAGAFSSPPYYDHCYSYPDHL